MNHSHSNAFITIIVYYNKDRKIDFQQRSKNMLLIDMVRHWLNLDKTYQHKKDQAEYKSFQMFDLFNHICRSPKLFSLNVHIWNSRNCLSYIRMLAHHFEWLLENLLVTMKESALCTAQKNICRPIVHNLGGRHYLNILWIWMITSLFAQVKHLLIKPYLSVPDRGI